jgi:hypothetical protein
MSLKRACLTPDHEVLTARGWVPIVDVTLGDMVLCVPDYQNRLEALEFRPPSRVRHYAVDEDLYHVSGDGIDQIVTYEHRLLVGNAPYFASAMALSTKTRRDRACKIVRALGDLRILSTVNPQQEDIDIIRKYIRTWRRAGSKMVGCVPEENEVASTAASSSKPYEADAITLRDEMVALEEDAVNVLRNACENPHLLLPWVIALSELQPRRLNIPKTALPWMQMLIALDFRISGLCKLWLDGPWATLGWMSSSDRRQDHTITEARFQKQPYKGLVHCLTVPGGVFCVRRNNCVSWTGNSADDEEADDTN